NHRNDQHDQRGRPNRGLAPPWVKRGLKHVRARKGERGLKAWVHEGDPLIESSIRRGSGLLASCGASLFGSEVVPSFGAQAKGPGIRTPVSLTRNAFRGSTLAIRRSSLRRSRSLEQALV